MYRLLIILIAPILLYPKAGAQNIFLTKSQVLKLPCKILRNPAGGYVSGYFNEMDSSLYSCKGNFKQTLQGGYAVYDNYACPETRPRTTTRPTCPVDYLSSINFTPGSVELDADTKAKLASAAFMLTTDSLCGIKIVGYIADSAAKATRQLGWDRVNVVLRYLIEIQAVDQSRIRFSYDASGPANTLDLLPLTLDEPKTAPSSSTQAKPTP